MFLKFAYREINLVTEDTKKTKKKQKNLNTSPGEGAASCGNAILNRLVFFAVMK
jgi:hypothetical protein